MASIRQLCTRGVMLNKGMVEFDGGVDECVDLYLRDSIQRSNVPIAERKDRQGNQKIRFTDIQVLDKKTGEPVTIVTSGQNVIIRFSYKSDMPEGTKVITSIDIRDMKENYISFFDSQMIGTELQLGKEGSYDCVIDHFPFNTGEYLISCSIMDESKKYYDDITNAIVLRVENGSFYTTGLLPVPRTGLSLVDAKFKVN